MAETPSIDLEEVDGAPWGSPATPAEIAAALDERPVPTTPIEYNVEEATLWQKRYIPPGSVLRFQSPYSPEMEPPYVAVMVVGAESREDGIWVKVKVVGASTPAEKKEADRYFKNLRREVHICYPKPDTGVCGQDDVDAMHIRKFTWFPPGDFDASWLSGAARKTIASGKKLEVDGQKRPTEPTGGRRPQREAAPSLVEKRLGALREKQTPRVTFADDKVRHATDGRGDSRPAAEGGAGGSHRRSPSLAVVKAREVKKEVDLVTSDSAAERKSSRKKPRGMGRTLARAARLRSAAEEAKESKKKRRSRSRSRGRRRRKKRHSSSSSGSRGSSGHKSSSSDESLMAPLKKRSMKAPGSVFSMLESTAVERLSADGIVEEGYEAEGLRHQRPKLLTYYQLILKPHLDPRGRDARELAVLARALDLLREGRLAELSDVLAARLIAIETSTRQGWATAKHLEVYNEDEDGAAPAHVLLSAQKHARQVEKAGGKGSWQRPAAWTQQDWSYESRPKGKGKDQKGKGKKGKGKGKGAKGWNYWGTEGKEKPGEKPKKSEGEP